jgi:hypothetical protein
LASAVPSHARDKLNAEFFKVKTTRQAAQRIPGIHPNEPMAISPLAVNVFYLVDYSEPAFVKRHSLRSATEIFRSDRSRLVMDDSTGIRKDTGGVDEPQLVTDNLRHPVFSC